jgi:2-keto-4-pentenoate hydratase/2-oxohepta-3-ene-1,7-dioic acid hydratase in catechol pathway
MNTRREFLMQAGVAGICAVGATVGANTALASTSQTESHRTKDAMIKNTKLLSIKHADGSESLGVVTDDGVIDVRATAKKLGMHLPFSVDDLLRHGATDDLVQLTAKAKHSGVPLLAESTIKHGRLFTNPGKIICVGLNYRQHAKEIGMPEPRVPPLFNKFNNALAAHQCVITLPPKEISTKLDYETELLFVIGKPCRNVAESDALDYVAGYCTSNDFSARDLQLELPAGQWMIGKTLDNFAPIGPYFVSADLVGDPNNLKLQTFVNGELRQLSNTSDFIFNIQKIIAYISKHWTLEPGDIIFTGTPQGVIAGKPKDEQVWLKAGDQVVSIIEKLGELRFSLA